MDQPGATVSTGAAGRVPDRTGHAAGAYPQLSSRAGFVHQYRALSTEELAFILTHKWADLGLTFAPDDFTDAEALAAIARITGGNFRLVERLCTQIERIVEINQLRVISKEVVEAARESLVIGPLN